MHALLFAPEFMQPLCPPAVELVEFVAKRILLVEILVILLGRIEVRSCDNLGGDRSGKLLGLLDHLLRLLRQALLIFIMIENGRAVLMALVTELPIRSRGINVVPEEIENLLVADLCRIIENLYRLRVACAARRHLLIGRIGLLPTRITGGG